MAITPFAVLFNFGISIILMRFIFFNKEFYFAENRNTFYALNLFLCLTVLLIFNTFSNRNANFISNFEKIKNKYCCTIQGSVNILYFNDKYIFIERQCKLEQKELIVTKFEDLFEIGK